MSHNKIKKHYRRIWPCKYCGKNLHLDRFDKRRMRVNGKKHIENKRDYCCLVCIKGHQDFIKLLRIKIVKFTDDVSRRFIEWILWKQIRRYPTSILRKILVGYFGKDRLVIVV